MFQYLEIPHANFHREKKIEKFLRMSEKKSNLHLGPSMEKGVAQVVKIEISIFCDFKTIQVSQTEGVVKTQGSFTKDVFRAKFENHEVFV
jgi:hypothetical protein